MIDEQTIQRIKDVSISELIGGYIKIKKEGSDFVGLCPFHNEKTPSFKISPSKGIFKCFGCGKNGDAISFVMAQENKTYPEALKIIAEKFNIELEESTNKKEFVKPVPRLEKVSKKTIEFFEGRGISNNTLLRFGITEAKEWMPKHNKIVDTICFNYFENEELVNIKFRGPKFINTNNKEEKVFKLAKDAKLIFYNIDSLKGEKTAVIVEGEPDCLSMYEAGIHNCVSVPNGAAKGNQKLEYLDNCWKDFEDKEKIIICVDNDEPGKMLQEELARRLDKSRCYLVEYPEGCKDANDVLKIHGKDYLKSMVENAKAYPLEGVLTVDDMAEDVGNMYLNGYPKGKKAGIPEFDDLISFVEGQLTMVTGIPGSGKDEFTNEISMGLAKNHGWKFGVCGFEEPPKITVTKLIEKHGRKSFNFRKNPDDRLSEQQFQEGLDFVNEHYKFMNMDELDATVDTVISKAIEMVKRYGINALIISPWNCFEHHIPPGSNETLYVSNVLGKIISCLAKYNLHCFLIAHPTKVMKDAKTGRYAVVTLYNISGSAHFFNKTHNGLSIDRDFSTGMVDVYVQKVKWSWLGRVDFCSFRYDTMTRQYYPAIAHVGESLPQGNWKPVEQGKFFVDDSINNNNIDDGFEGDAPF